MNKLIPGKLYRICSNNPFDLKYGNIYSFYPIDRIKINSKVIFIKYINTLSDLSCCRILYKNKIYSVKSKHLYEIS